MSKTVELQVAPDHVEALTEVNGVLAMAELIWNALDADAHNISIDYKMTSDFMIDELTVRDDGHGMDYDEAMRAFSKLGGSSKRHVKYSPQNRLLHGKSGKGRLRAFALGHLIRYNSIYREDKKSNKFKITLDRNQIRSATFGKLKKGGSDLPGVEIQIQNLHQRNVVALLGKKGLQSLEEHLAVYYMSYPNFQIKVNDKLLNFTKFIRNQSERTETFQVRYLDRDELHDVDVTFRLLHWNKPCSKQVFFCNTKGVSFLEHGLQVSTGGYPLTLHIMSDYISDLQERNILMLKEMDGALTDIFEAGKEFVREYVEKQNRIDELSYISALEKEGVYPFEGIAKTKADKELRRVFNHNLLKMNAEISAFQRMPHPMKRIFLQLLKSGLAQDSKGVQELISDTLD